MAARLDRGNASTAVSGEEAKTPEAEASDQLAEENAQLTDQVAELQRMLEREREERRQLARRLAELGSVGLVSESSGGADPAASRGETVVAALRHWAAVQPEKTLYTWLDEQGNEEQAWTYRELQMRANAVSHALLHQWGCEQGDRAALMYLPGLDFIAGFWGCLFAGVIAVPVYPVDLRGDKFELEVERFGRIVADCEPKLVLSHSQYLSMKRLHAVRNMFGSRSWPAGLEFVATGGLEPRASCETDYRPVPEQLAFLQFTSGSTGEPKGVMLSQGNLADNCEQMTIAYGGSQCLIVISWLPQFHDMGLIGKLLYPAFCGGSTVAMAPLTFIASPLRWLQTVSKYKGNQTGAPNFAYVLCLKKIDMQDRRKLDFRHVQMFMNAAEPFSPKVVERFIEGFAEAGMQRRMLMPGYGLAENSVFVCCSHTRGVHLEPVITSFHRKELQESQHALAASADHPMNENVVLVSSGHTCSQTSICIALELDDGQLVQQPDSNLGEICWSSPSKAQGYWGKPQLSQQTFRATIQHDPTSTEYLRTGDLGFIHEGELYVCGRLKDLIIVRGKNYYPQDIERTAEASQKLLKPGCSAAFSVEAAGEERLVVVAEVRGEPDAPTRQAVLEGLRAAVALEHGLEVQAALLLKERTVLKTTSGKIRRQACKQGFLAWCKQQQPVAKAASWTDLIRSGVSGLCQAVLPVSSPSGALDVSAHFVDMDGLTGDFNLAGLDGAELAFSDCLDDPDWIQNSQTPCDALVIGAGIVGLCFARDLASEGYSVVVVEKSEGIGGTWRTNDYPGLRLHQPGATYRCLSLAPDWTKHHDADEWYRPTRKEVMAYIEQLAAHPLISVVLNCEYLGRSKEHGQSSFVISTSKAEVRARFVLESTGCFINNCGAPRIPRELDELRAGRLSGPGCFHASQLSSEVFSRVVASEKVVIVGSGKAAIDLLQQLKPGQQTMWAHRGHTSFIPRQTFSDFSQDGRNFRETVFQYMSRSGSSHWSTAAVKDGWLISCEGPITAQDVKTGGGVVDPAELEWANQFEQLDLRSIDAFEGGVTFRGTSRRPLEEVTVGPGDCIVLCTGQSSPWPGLPKLEPGYAKAIPFTLFSATLNSLVPLCLALEHLRGGRSRYHGILSRCLQGLAADPGFSTLTDPRSIEYGVTDCSYNGVIPQFFPAICEYNFSMRHEWVEDWYGVDLNVADTLRSWGMQLSNILDPTSSSGGADLVAISDYGQPKTSQIMAAPSLEAIKAIVHSQVCTKVGSRRISAEDSLQNIGLDSLKIAALAGSLGTELRMTVSPSILYEYPTILSAAKHLTMKLSEQVGMPDQIHFRYCQSLASLDLGAVDKAVECMVIDKVRKTAGVTVGASDPLMDNGVDLLAATKLRNSLQSELGAAAKLPSTLVFDYPTVAAVAQHITAQFVCVCGIAEACLPMLPAAEAASLPVVASDGVESGQSLLCATQGGSATPSLPQMMTVLHKPDELEQKELLPPLFMAAGGFGSSAAYCELASSLGGSRMVYGLDFEGSVPDAVKQARIDAHSIQQVLPPGGKVHLGGLSSGGYTSFFTASLLQQAGFDVRCVFLLDPLDPSLFRMMNRLTLIRDLLSGAGVLPEHIEEALESPLEAFPAYPYLNRLFSAQKVHDYLYEKGLDADVASNSYTAEPLVGNAEVVYFYTKLRMDGEAKVDSTEWHVEALSRVTVSLPCNHARVLSQPEAFSIVTSTMIDRMHSAECQDGTASSLFYVDAEKTEATAPSSGTLKFEITFVQAVLCMQGSPLHWDIFCQQLQHPTVIFASLDGKTVHHFQTGTTSAAPTYERLCEKFSQDSELPWRTTKVETGSHVSHFIDPAVLDRLDRLGITNGTPRHLFYIAAEFSSFKAQYYGILCGSSSFVVELLDPFPNDLFGQRASPGLNISLPSIQPTAAPAAQQNTSCPHLWSTGQVAGWMRTLPGCASCADWIERHNIDGRKLAKIVNGELDNLGAKQDFSYHFLTVRFKSLLRQCPCTIEYES